MHSGWELKSFPEGLFDQESAKGGGVGLSADEGNQPILPGAWGLALRFMPGATEAVRKRLL